MGRVNRGEGEVLRRIDGSVEVAKGVEEVANEPPLRGNGYSRSDGVRVGHPPERKKYIRKASDTVQEQVYERGD
jgi:hypothetical protein